MRALADPSPVVLRERLSQVLRILLGLHVLHVRQERPVPSRVLPGQFLGEPLPGVHEDLVVIADVRRLVAQEGYRESGPLLGDGQCRGNLPLCRRRRE